MDILEPKLVDCWCTKKWNLHKHFLGILHEVDHDVYRHFRHPTGKKSSSIPLHKHTNCFSAWCDTSMQLLPDSMMFTHVWVLTVVWFVSSLYKDTVMYNEVLYRYIRYCLYHGNIQVLQRIRCIFIWFNNQCQWNIS